MQELFAPKAGPIANQPEFVAHGDADLDGSFVKDTMDCQLALAGSHGARLDGASRGSTDRF
jgi:hypothetical protein